MGVLAYAANQHRRKIGVRMALGALSELVLRQFLGLGAGIAGIRMRRLLFDIPVSHAGVARGGAALIMAMVVVLATLLPSRRASRVSPIESLRDD